MEYGIVMQGTLGEFSRYPEKFVLIETLLGKDQIKGITVAAPSLDLNEAAKEKLESLKIPVYVGEDYNVARRILNAHKSAGWKNQQMVVRICSSWSLINLELINNMMKSVEHEPCSYLCLPKDFDYTTAADIASQEALEYIASFPQISAEACRALFNPWSYLEAYSEKFHTRIFEDVPTYTREKVDKRIGQSKLVYDENEFFGRDYAGSRYDGLIGEIKPEDKVLDMATGSGHGAARLSQKASFVVGVDYLPKYVQTAKRNYPEHERLSFLLGDASDFLYKEGNFFTVAISLHTIEHVPNERELLRTLRRNLITQGTLIIEVPIMMARPWGRPTNPYHLREYSKERIEKIVVEEGFKIENRIVGCRGIYLTNLKKMRGEYRLHARKL
jgi:ubiquinone/menaquinone biosynthesis C-methylase UbiE/spore coat polysaccharide biosynthesis protein SpsF (cytidylyltransferase family)